MRTWTILLAATTCSTALAQESGNPDAEWLYRVPARGERGEHPTPTALPLGTDAPEDLKVAVRFTSDFQRYGQLRYGDPDSTRMAVVVDQRGIGDADLYVDVDRDRVIEEHERLELAGERWVTSLAVETEVDGKPAHLPRRVVFQLGTRGGILSYATMGFLEGELDVEGRTLAARRVDGDGNGFFTDSRDQLWLDLDESGSLSPLRELYLYAPTLTIEGQRYALRSDRLGARFAVERIDGLGTIDVTLPEQCGEVRALSVLLVGRDGSAVGVRAVGAPVEVPIGEYRVGMVTFSLADGSGGQDWSFVFSEPGGRDDIPWYDVQKDAQVAIDAVGALRLEVGVAAALESCAPGDRLNGSPALYTGDGLLINVAYRGRSAPQWSYGGMAADVQLLSEEGRLLDRATSGFA